MGRRWQWMYVVTAGLVLGALVGAAPAGAATTVTFKGLSIGSYRITATVTGSLEATHSVTVGLR